MNRPVLSRIGAARHAIWRARSSHVAAVLLFVGCACGDRDGMANERPPGAIRAATTDSLEVAQAITRIEMRVDSIRGIAKRHGDRVQLFSAGAERLTPVEAGDIVTEYRILFDSRGSPLMHSETPESESGDWDAELTHFFDSTGRTMLYEVVISSFGTGCAEILREHKRVYYDSTFRVLRDTVTFADGDGRPIATSDCERRIESWDLQAWPRYTALPQTKRP